MIRRQQIPEELGRYALLAVALLYLVGLVALPLVVVFVEAFAKGIGSYILALLDPYALAAMRLTLLTAAIVVPLNLAFGIAAAWAIARPEPATATGRSPNSNFAARMRSSRSSTCRLPSRR